MPPTKAAAKCFRHGSLALSAEDRHSDGWQAQYTATGTAEPVAIDIHYADKSRNVFAQLEHQSLSVRLYHNDATLTGNRLGETQNDYSTSLLEASYNVGLGDATQLDINLAWQNDTITIDTSFIEDNIFALELIAKGSHNKGRWIWGGRAQLIFKSVIDTAFVDF